MSLLPDITELLARARADLRMGVPVVLQGDGMAALAIAAETLAPERLADLRALDATPVVAITARRAETLKARAYDGDVARIELPRDADGEWVRALADPADDLIAPMKGPLVSRRDGSAALHRMAIRLTKNARLLPAVVMVDLADGAATARDFGLTRINHALATPHLQDASPLHPVIHARLPMDAAEAGQVHIFRPEDGGEDQGE